MPEDGLTPATPAPDGTVPELKTRDQELFEQAVEALRTVYDPEIPVNIWDLGLIYRLKVDPDGSAEVDMTLTTPNCPVAADMPGMVWRAVTSVEGITECKVELVWEPPWHPGQMSEAAKLLLDMF
jgi:FeS assembly SUF system protein